MLKIIRILIFFFLSLFLFFFFCNIPKKTIMLTHHHKTCLWCLCVCLVVPPSQIFFKSPSTHQDTWKAQSSGGWQWANHIRCKIMGYYNARTDAHGWRELSRGTASASHWFLSGQQPGRPSPSVSDHKCPCPVVLPLTSGMFWLLTEEERTGRHLGVTGKLHEGAGERNLITWCCWQMDFESGCVIFNT